MRKKQKKYHIEKGHRKHKIRKITLLQLGTEEFILKAVRNSDAKSRILSENQDHHSLHNPNLLSKLLTGMDEILIVTQTNKLWFNADQCKPNCPAGASKKTN